MIATLLLLLVGGVALTQAVSDPRQVTLRWLQLGGLINVALLAVAATLHYRTQGTPPPPGVFWPAAAAAVAAIAQLLAVQMGWRGLQRLFAAATFACAPLVTQPPAYLSAGLLGGFLMTMLLGHAYLTAGNEMTQAPFLRLVGLLMVLLGAQLLASLALGAWPYFHQAHDSFARPQTWNVMLIAARYGAGLAVPTLFTWMTWDCVKRRANQSATGILYVASVLVILGEGIALSLRSGTGLGF